MAVFDVKSVLSSLKTKYNIPDEELPIQEVEAGFLRQDAFSRRQQELDKRNSELDARASNYQQYENFLNQMESHLGPREQWTADTLARVNANYQQSGQQQYQQPPLDMNVLNRQMQSIVDQALTKQREELMSEIDNAKRQTTSVAAFIPKAYRMWDKQFASEDFPEEDFYKYMQPPTEDNPPGPGYGLPLHTALQLFMQPKLEAKRDQSFEERLKLAREEGAREALSRVNSLEPDAMPSGGGIFGNSPSFLGGSFNTNPDQPAQDLSDAQKIANFSKNINAARDGLSTLGLK